MRWYILKFLAFFAFIPAMAQAQTDQWKTSIVKIESVVQRYNQEQVDQLLQKRLGNLKKNISQHETFEIRDSLDNIKDTIQGTGILVADAGKLYIVTAKHIIKTTRPYGNTQREVMNDVLTIHLDGSAKKTNDINLSDLISASPAYSPVIFSDDHTDLAVISLQQYRRKGIVNYIRQNGGSAIPIQNMDQQVAAGQEISTVGFTALKRSNTAHVSTGKLKAADGNTLTVDMPVYPGNSGGPLIHNARLAGVLSYPTGITNNMEAADRPDEKAGSSKAIKASAIIPLLNQLQTNEHNQAFNR